MEAILEAPTNHKMLKIKSINAKLCTDENVFVAVFLYCMLFAYHVLAG